jgi:NAD(P)-dependent dehydrogenase (short-subunit alcohol dehydrogenase family)
MARPVAFVTGASRGIGRASAVALAAAGFDVAVSARTLVDGSARLDDGVTVVPGGLDTTVNEITAAGAAGFGVAMDVLDRASVLAAADAVLERFGRIDLLLNNAIYQGPGAMTLLRDLDEAETARLFEGNVHAHLALIGHLLPTFVAQGGATVMNMISATAYQEPPGPIGKGGWGVAYAMTKAAFARIVPIMHVEHRDDGLVGYNIDPGYVVTERASVANKARGFEQFPGATPGVIGAVVAWLATDPDSAGEYAGQTVFAQREAKRRGLR